MAVNSKTNMIYSSDPSSNTLRVVNGSTNQVVKSINIDSSPSLAIDQTRNRVYSSGISCNFSRGWITVTDGGTNAIVGQIQMNDPPGEMTFDSTTGTLFVLSAGAVAGTTTNTLYEVDGIALRVLGSVPIGNAPNLLVADSEKNVVYVTDTSPNRPYKVDAVGKQILVNTSLNPGGNSTVGQPNGLSVDESTSTVLLSQRADTNLSMFYFGLPGATTSSISSSSIQSSTASESSFTATTISTSESTSQTALTSSSVLTISSNPASGHPSNLFGAILAVVGVFVLVTTTFLVLRRRGG
jgi:hypothetical protein